MDRRKLLTAGALIMAVSPAMGQTASREDQTGGFESNARAVENMTELYFLVDSMQSLIFLMTIGVLAEQEALLRSRSEFSRYASFLTNEKLLSDFNRALVTDPGHTRAANAWSSVVAASKQLDGLLVDVASDRVRKSLIKSFARTSVLLAALLEDGVSWWCQIYGLRKFGCA